MAGSHLSPWDDWLHRTRYSRRRAGVVLGALAVVGGLGIGARVISGGGNESSGESVAAEGPTTSTTQGTTTTTSPIPASQRELTLIDTIGGDLASKSIVAGPNGQFFAQNMMYQHTVSVFDRDFELVKTISDRVRPFDFGIGTDQALTLQGAPVEAAFLPDGSAAYVSNYHMYGPGYGPEPSDSCPRMDTDDSYLYRIGTESLTIEEIIKVGTVPKFLAVSPDGSTVLVSNWCSYDVSVVDVAEGKETMRIDVGRYPRGIAFAPDGKTAYLGVMGADKVLRLDMETLEVTATIPVSGRPRHLVMDPAGEFLYITRNFAGDVVKLDLDTDTIVDTVATGEAPRSMTISDDGEALYVVNYESNTMSKVLTADMREIQELPTGNHPIGITYDAGTDRIWVANYSGTLMIFADEAIEVTTEAPTDADTVAAG